MVGVLALSVHSALTWFSPWFPLGKSSLTVQFVDGHFVDSYYPTIENTFSKAIKHRGQDFATEIVDTAGQVSAMATRLFASYQASRVFCCFGECQKRPLAAVIIER